MDYETRSAPYAYDAGAERRAAASERWQEARRRLGEIVVTLAEDPGVRTASWRLPPNGRSAATARRLTRARLTAWGMEDRLDVAELLVSELVTNALEHARGPIRLTLSAIEGLLRCEVEDSETALPRLHDADDDEEGGRGLRLLDVLACCWGGIRTPDGKVVWFELPAALAA
ncbi:ATP-binding protein [Microbispora sp. NPDC049125]|uniref:ATP-binding protein n=1 Tax=Microbispora sp. NPDC049125 TaxID=3154929 RepID=UPI0034675817